MTRPVYRRVKRGLDLALTGPLLLLSLPVQAAVAIAIRARMGTPVLFRQERPGLHGKPFRLVKFRTMTRADATTVVAEDGLRITGLGGFLRSTSLDELPTLWNVLTGSMSLVGPRPLLLQYLDRYTPQQARRHEVTPGLTGLAQVSGRNAITWEDKLRLDVEYVDQASLSLDLRILARTVVSVLRREGIAAEGTATMTEFMGR